MQMTNRREPSSYKTSKNGILVRICRELSLNRWERSTLEQMLKKKAKEAKVSLNHCMRRFYEFLCSASGVSKKKKMALSGKLDFPL